MTDDERALLLAVAKFVASGLDTPFTLRRHVQELMRKLEKTQKE